MKLNGALLALVMPSLITAQTTYGPSDMQEICGTVGGERVCHRFGKMMAPLDHEQPSAGEHELVYFVNSNFWDPENKPNGPIFINMAYGSTGSSYTDYSLRMVDDSSFTRGMPGTSVELARDLGALIINVPNRYYGCESARAGDPEGTCPTSLDEIPEGVEGQAEAHERLQYLTLEQVVDDIALVARETLSTYARDWGMLVDTEGRAPNKPVVLGCSWPGAAAVYARMRHPDVFPGAVATSMPLISSPAGNNHYRTFVGHAYELYASGGSLECRNVLTAGHKEIQRRIEQEGVDSGPVGSCVQDCSIAAAVNRDFGLAETRYWSFGGGVPGLPGVQSINRDCTTLGCNIETTCEFLLECFNDSTDEPFPISSETSTGAAKVAYECLADFSAARARMPAAQASEEDEEMVFNLNAERFEPANDLGPNVYTSNTLIYQMFGFKGPLWMVQTCNDDSGCPFAQGKAGGASYEQINARLWTSYAKPGQSLEDFERMMQEGASDFQEAYGGQTPWKAAGDSSSIYMVYNDADPWTGTGALRHYPSGQDMAYDLGGGGVSHCVYPAPEAQEYIRKWTRVEASAVAEE